MSSASELAVNLVAAGQGTAVQSMACRPTHAPAAASKGRKFAACRLAAACVHVYTKATRQHMQLHDCAILLYTLLHQHGCLTLQHQSNIW